MQNNCLITKLKSVVDNEFLQPYDTLSIIILPHSSNAPFEIKAPGATLKLAGNAQLYDTISGTNLGKTVVLSSSDASLAVTPCDSVCVLFIGPKYGGHLPILNINNLNYSGLDLKDFSYLYKENSRYMFNSFLSTPQNTVFGDFSALYGRQIKSLSIHSDLINGSINDFMDGYTDASFAERITIGGANISCVLDDWSAFTSLYWLGIITPDFRGDFSELAKMPALIRFSILYSPLVTGSVEDFAEIAKLRGAGKIQINEMKSRLPNVTYQGIKISENDNVPSYNYLNWDAEGNVSWTTS